MADRTDIDALLIGALYGELTPADEARLAAHFESHPADRTALADLGQIRSRVREHRGPALAAEPPQSISARLLQEAARSAPRDREAGGWFQRWTRSVFAHPAMATAAMFVVVVGVAGALYLRNGEQFVMSSERMEAAPAASSGPAVASAPAVPAEGSAELAHGSRVDSSDARPAPAAEPAPVASGRAMPDSPPPAAPLPAPSAVSGYQVPSKPLAKQTKGGGIELRPPPPPTVIDLDDGPSNDRELRRDTVAKKVRAAAKSSRDDELAKEGATAETDNAEPMGKLGTGGAGAAAPALARPVAPPAAAAPAEPETAASDPAALAWARTQHGRVIALVKSNQCAAAATAAIEIYTRAPAYYASSVANDRAIAPCQANLRSARAVEDRKRAAVRGSDAPADALRR